MWPDAFTPSAWEDFYVAFNYARLGEPERGRRAVEEALAREPEAWEGSYNAACFEALAGEPDAALAHLQRAIERNRESVLQYAAEDIDFDSIRNDPRFAELMESR